MKNQYISSLILLTLLVFNASAHASSKSEADKIVNESLKTLNVFAIDPNLTAFQRDLKRARGFLIIPKYYKGGFGLGGAGGTGVLVRKFPNEGQMDISVVDQWSYPAFYTMGSVTLGLQVGGQVAEIIMVILSERGLDAFLSSNMQLGADASIAAGPVGKGTQVATRDIIIYSRAVGAFGGLTGEGAYVTARDSLNSAYYGKKVSPLDILVTGRAGNMQANGLRARLSELTSH